MFILFIYEHHDFTFFFFLEKRKSCLLKLLLFSHKVVTDSFETSRTVACQAPLFMGFSRQEYWNGLPFPSPGDLPHPGIEPASPTLWANSLLLRHRGKLRQEKLCFSLYSPKCSGWGTVSQIEKRQVNKKKANSIV